jgi:hypothetical protein
MMAGFARSRRNLTGRDTRQSVRCSMLAPPVGGGERETGRGPEAVVGQLLGSQARLTVWSFRKPLPAPRSGTFDPG